MTLFICRVPSWEVRYFTSHKPSGEWLIVRHCYTCIIQWNPIIADTIGELHVGSYREPAVAEGFYKYYMNEIRT